MEQTLHPLTTFLCEGINMGNTTKTSCEPRFQSEQMPQSTAADQGLNCLPLIQCSAFEVMVSSQDVF